MQRNLNIIFMGTPEFAIPSLDILLKNKYKVSAVVTAPDKPAGRGKKLRMSAIKEFALSKDLPVLQPTNLKDEDFHAELKSYEANLFIIVAFRMLPIAVWEMPDYGSFNLHASLLPQYRGAAPMNWAIINGEKETGLTTFFLNERIDTGDIILQEKVIIEENASLGNLHDIMKDKGAELVLKTVQGIENGSIETRSQSIITNQTSERKPAPKIFRDDCEINWNNNGESVRNLIRGLNPIPGAFSHIISPDGESFQIKLFDSAFIQDETVSETGLIDTDGKNYLKISVSDGWINLFELQISGKKRMKINEFLRGFALTKSWIAR